MPTCPWFILCPAGPTDLSALCMLLFTPQVPHNRETSRRITSMGFVKDRLVDGLWMSTAGGDISKTPAGNIDTLQINIPFDKLQVNILHLTSYILHLTSYILRFRLTSHSTSCR